MASFTSGKRHHDPRPWQNIHDGSRWPDNWSNWDGLHYLPRPSFDNHNSMLEDFRRVVASDPAFDSAELAAYWLKHWATVTYLESPEHVEHAHRVLTLIVTTYEES